MKKQVIYVILSVLIIGSTTAGYFIAKDNKMEYALSGTLVGLIVSLIVWAILAKRAT